MISSVVGEIIVLSVPHLLSPLHLASYHSYKVDNERKRKLKRLSKKMILIKNRFTNIGEEQQSDLLDNINRIELFHQVYSHIDKLTVKELNVLRDFCYTLYDPYDLRISRDNQETEQDIYYQYSSKIDNFIDSKTYKK